MNWLSRRIDHARTQFKHPDPDILAGAVTAGVAGRAVMVGSLAVMLGTAGLWYGAVICAIFVALDVWTGFHVLRTILEAVRGAVARAWMSGFTMNLVDDETGVAA